MDEKLEFQNVMCELEKGCFDVNTESSPLVLDESHCMSAVTKSKSISISNNNKGKIDFTKIKKTQEQPTGNTYFKDCNPGSGLLHQKPFVPRIEIVTSNECCNSITHQCLILPPQTPIKVTIETGIDTHFIETGGDTNLDLYPFAKLKNWLHQYLTFWLFIFISLVQIVLTYHQDGASIESGLSYIIQPLVSDGLQENHLRVYPCGHATPSS